MTQNEIKVVAEAAGAGAKAPAERNIYLVTLKIKSDVFSELSVVKDKSGYDTWSSFFSNALVRCPACGSVLVVKHYKIKCVICSREYKLAEVNV
ncbi:MAG: hypothetical protein QW794_07950 [Thermosphaera sp.]